MDGEGLRLHDQEERGVQVQQALHRQLGRQGVHARALQVGIGMMIMMTIMIMMIMMIIMILQRESGAECGGRDPYHWGPAGGH